MSDDEVQAPLPPTIGEEFAEDTFKILLATDNHIGYNERDPIRGQDSINTFREILQLAVKHEVDFILLAGDLFHENRPSRDCLYQVMGLLREYTMGTKPVEMELLSDPNEGKAAGYSFPAINYEDTNFNVGIPVFSIHGNHDDPQGAGPEGALCALDMLSVSGLVNYIGKVDLPLSNANANSAEPDGIAVKPILLRKGNTYLGLYGIGNVKDARMHFELRSNRVRMYMPKDKDNWFNVLLLHQNRVRHGPQESVPEGMFDDSVDLVIWGHEHDCRIIPEPVAGKRYFISQPGSSVATSLAEGESIEKHVALLKVQGKEFSMEPLPLRTVRPFVMDEVVLTEVAEEVGFDVTDQMEITKYLKGRVNDLIQKANDDWQAKNQEAIEQGQEPIPPMLPLVRLKVDTTGVSAMSNPIRFGQEFTGKLANPRDVLVFHRAKQQSSRRVAADEPNLLQEDDEDGRMGMGDDGEGGLGRVRVHTLVQEYLRAQELQLLGENGMADAVQVFVEKDDIHAIEMHVNEMLDTLRKGVKDKGEFNEENFDGILEKVREQAEKEYQEEQLKGKSKKAKGKGKARAADDEDDEDAQSVDSMAMDVDANGDDLSDDEPPPPKKGRGKAAAAAPAKKAPAKKAATTGRGKKKVVESESEDDEEDEEEEPQPKKKTGRAAASSQAATKKAPAKKPAASKTSAKQATLSFAPGGRTTGRAAASKARAKNAEVIELDSD